MLRLWLAFVTTLLTAAAVGGCKSSHGAVLEWHGSEQGLAHARSAAQEWRDVCGADVWVRQEGEGGAPMTEVPTGEFVDGRPGLLGLTYNDPEGRVLGVFVTRFDGQQTTIAHELGHALGGALYDHPRTGLMAVELDRGDGEYHVTAAECALLP